MSEPIAKAVVPCVHFVVSQSTQFSLIDILDSFHPRSFPTTIQFCLFFLIADPPSAGHGIVQLENESGTVVWTSGPIPFKLRDVQLPWMSECVRVGPVQVFQPGSYRAAVLIGNSRAGDAIIRVCPIPV